MSKAIWCILILAVLLLVSCDSATDTSSAVSQENSAVSQEETSANETSSDASPSETASSAVTSDGQSTDDLSNESTAQFSGAEESSITESGTLSSESEFSDESEPTDDSSEEISFENSTESSAASSEEPTESSTEESSKEQSSEDSSTPTEDPTPTLSSVNRNNMAVNLAEGKSYKISVDYHTQYPDNGNKLTDGVYKSSFDSNNWVGFAPPKNTVITLDLGKVEHDIADLGVGTLRLLEYGIGSPENIVYEISEDGKTYKKVGTGYRPKDVSSQAAFAYGIKLQEPVSARYIRYTINNINSSWLFLGELYAVKYLDEEKATSYYPTVKLPEVSSAIYWPSNTTDKDKTVNLIASAN